MATPTSKATLKDYCLRALGKPVIDVNVDDDQIDDRVDEALQYFAEYHYDGIERMYLKHKITSAEITRAGTNQTTVGTDIADNAITANWEEGKGFIPIPTAVVSVIRMFSIGDAITRNMFDVRYQLRLQDLWDFSTMDMFNYEMQMQVEMHFSHAV